jgi:hypothetical protein
VPRLFLARLPADLPTLDSVSLRKEVFVKMLLPLILPRTSASSVSASIC